MSLINFKLNKVEGTIPFEIGGNVTSWFSLTDGELWLVAGDARIYEYSVDSQSFFLNQVKQQFNEYYISRFVEDFSEIFSTISEPLPDFMHDCVTDYGTLSAYQSWATSFLEDDYQEKRYIEKDLEIVVSWIYKRALPSNHLLGGPTVWFFRINDQIKIIWRANYEITPGCNLWTYPYGAYVMPYDLFVKEIQHFGRRFFTQMKHRIDSIKDYDPVAFDLDSIRTQNVIRQLMFENDVLHLLNTSALASDWDIVRNCYKK